MPNIIGRIFLAMFVLIPPCGGVIFAQSAPATITGDPQAFNPGAPWPATDALGRAVPVAGEAPALRPDRFVGIFYFLSIGPPTPDHDISKILAKHPDAIKKPELWSPRCYFWGESLFGYYKTLDPWVLRRHANLLADAGIDTLIFDVTNRTTYPEVYLKLCEIFSQVRRDGGRTPQICFMANSQAGETADELYSTLYKPGRYKDLWFLWQGRPLLMCDPQQASAEVKAFFTLRRTHWPDSPMNTPYAWHWMAAFPQVYGYTDDPNRPEMVNVSVAQNLRADGSLTCMSEGDARGRSFHNGARDLAPDAVNWGHNIAEQWQRAYALDPPFVMVTGWNEWTAFCFQPASPTRTGGVVYFWDQYNQEYSRDVEPMKGSHGDNYYCQMVAAIRRYKGAAPLLKASAAKTIDIGKSFDQWADVLPEFSDHVGDTMWRDWIGSGDLRYTDASGRNDLVAAKIARDDKQVAFYIRTREALSPRTDSRWMWLAIDADRNSRNGWFGADFIVNRTLEADGTSWLEKADAKGGWTKVTQVKLASREKALMIVIPRAGLGLAEGTTALALDFKWIDNMQRPEDALDLYVSGDTAPDGRFYYRYVAE